MKSRRGPGSLSSGATTASPAAASGSDPAGRKPCRKANLFVFPLKDRQIMALDPRFLAGGGRDVFTGNELLVKGCLEVDGGVHLMTGYPGSPVAGFFDILGDLSKLIQ